MARIYYSIDSISINHNACCESLHHFVVPLPLTREAWVVSGRRFNKEGWGLGEWSLYFNKGG
jgi:hypothetical protein